MRKNDLSEFLQYALGGFRDGLQNVLDVIQENQRQITWTNYIYGKYDRWIDVDHQHRPTAKRRRNLIRRMPTDKWMTPEEMLNVHSSIFQEYGGDTKSRAFFRDLNDLVKDELLLREKKLYRANIDILRGFMAQSATD